MKTALFLVFSVIFLFNFVENIPVDNEETDWGDFIDKIPENEKNTFYKQQFFKGYHLSNKDDYIYDVPDKVTSQIFEYFLENKKVKDTDSVQLEAVICLPNGDCFDTDDPGVRPF